MSTVPAVLAALTALGTTTLPLSQVINGPRGNAATESGRLLLVGGDSDDAVTSGATEAMVLSTMEDQYSVLLTVSVDVPGTDQTAADALADADWTAMKTAIRGYPDQDLGLKAQGVIRVLTSETFAMRRIATQTGRNTVIRFPVSVYVHRTG